MTHDMAAAIVCREYGWTLDEYLDQPQSWIDTIVDMLIAESAEQEKRNKRSA